MADIFCARCGEDAPFAAGCEGPCARVLCEDCQGLEGYCPECYAGEPVAGSTLCRCGAKMVTDGPHAVCTVMQAELAAVTADHLRRTRNDG